MYKLCIFVHKKFTFSSVKIRSGSNFIQHIIYAENRGRYFSKTITKNIQIYTYMILDPLLSSGGKPRLTLVARQSEGNWTRALKSETQPALLPPRLMSESAHAVAGAKSAESGEAS